MDERFTKASEQDLRVLDDFIRFLARDLGPVEALFDGDAHATSPMATDRAHWSVEELTDRLTVAA